MAVAWQVTGLKELEGFLKELPDFLRRGVVRKALRNAALIVEADAKRLAPVLKTRKPGVLKRRTPGTVRDAIRVSAGFAPSGGTVVAVKVGVKRLRKTAIAEFKRTGGKGGAQNPDDPFYARYLERGTSKMSKRSFMRPALVNNAFDVVERFKERLRGGIDAEFKKLLLKHKGRV